MKKTAQCLQSRQPENVYNFHCHRLGVPSRVLMWKTVAIGFCHSARTVSFVCINAY